MKNDYLYNATITNVVDGDTIDATVDLGFDIHFNTRIRLYGIDTPELNSKIDYERTIAREAREFVQNSILGKRVVLRTHKKDKYGRYLAEVFTGGILLNQLLIENNLAKPYI